MNASMNATPAVPAPMHATRPMFWSVQRELWENRSIAIVPLIAAGIMLFGFLLSTLSLAYNMPALLQLEPVKQHPEFTKPYNISAVFIIVAAFLTGVFYCLDALYGERRDRSILFWKSLPVSDFTTVLAKASIPLAVLPIFAFVVIIATQLVMLVLSSIIMLGNDLSPSIPWAQWPIFRESWVLAYGLVTLALWHAPVYGWLLLVSGWAKKSTFLWAVLPIMGLSVLERISFGTAHFYTLMKYRLMGGFEAAFVMPVRDPTGKHPVPFEAIPDPAHFLGSPAVWIGLVFAVAFLAAAIWMRRNRDPI